MAAIVSRAVKKLEVALADAQTAQKVNAADIAAVRKLVDEYGDQLKAVQKDVEGLKTQVASNTATLDRQQFHLYYFLRAPGTYRDRVSGYSAAGVAAPGRRPVHRPRQRRRPAAAHLRRDGARHRLPDAAHGVQRQRRRQDLVRDPAREPLLPRQHRTATAARSATPPAASRPGWARSPTTALLRLNYAALTYKDPSGLYARAGRFVEGGGDIGLAFADYFNGGELGYASKNNRLSGFVGYSFNKASNSNAAPYTGQSSQTLFGRLATTVGAHGSLGANFINDTAFYGGGPTVFNPATLRYQQVATNLAVGSIDAGYAFSKYFGLKAEFLHRFGNNPLGGGNWDQPNAFWGQGTLGLSGKTGNNYADFGYIYAGMNSTSVHTEIEGTPDYQQFFINNPNGYKIGYLGLHHFFSDKAQIGLIYQGYGLNGRAIPIDSYFFGTGAGRVTTPCLGCQVRRDDGQALFLETRLSF